MEIREKIVKELLHKIDVNMDTSAVEDSVAVFAKFIDALAIEASSLNHDIKVEADSVSNKEAEEAADAYMRDFSILFQLSGDHQKEVDEIFARSVSRAAKIAEAALSAVNESDMHRNANEVASLLDIIKATRKYVEQTNHTAKVKHDTPGIFYMDGGTYTTIEETKELLSRIDTVINEG